MTRRTHDREQLAVVVYPGVNLLELIGTTSVLDGLRLNTGFRPVTVAASRDPLPSDTPAKIVAQRSFEEIPHPAAVLVPGGGLAMITAMGDQQLLDYVRKAGESAELVASVGTGSLLLAAAGLLTGKRATTHWAYRRVLEHLGATLRAGAA